MSDEAELATMPDYEPLWQALREHGNLRKACRDLDISRSHFLDLCTHDKGLADQYTREKQFGIDAMMEDLLDAPIEDAAKDRLEWDRKRWHASKLFGRKYGDKTLVGSDPENPLPTPTLSMAGLSEATLRELAAQGEK